MLRHASTKLFGARRFVFFLSLAAILWAGQPAMAGSAERRAQADESPYRSLTLIPPPAPRRMKLFPVGVYERHPAGDANTAPLIRSNWRKMKIPAAPDGHFYVKARVKKKPPSYSLVDIVFLVDTGATLVALTREDAESLGFEDRDLEFSGVSQTANGEVRFASVVLPELRVGSFKVKDLPASVVDGELKVSLLGNSFLSQLKSYQVSNDELVLRW